MKFEVFYSDGCRQRKVTTTAASANAVARDLYKSGVKEIEIFRAAAGFHSTVQDEFLIGWWGNGTYWDNVAQNKPELFKKRLKF